jgi:Holliday junction resolvase
MNMSNKGTRKERKIRDIYEKAGWIVVRSAGSQSPFDLICWKDNEMHIIQLKYGSDRYLKYGFKAEEEAYKQYKDTQMNVKFRFVKLKKRERYVI